VLVYELEYVAGKQIEEMMDEKLVLIRTSQKAGPYVYVDWGLEYRRQHDIPLPEYAKSSLC
jgi:hypothetical protein